MFKEAANLVEDAARKTGRVRFHTAELDCRELLEQPIFCFTTDIDWAAEPAIEATLQLFDRYKIPLTPFITNESLALRARYSAPDLKERVGLHPNFLPHSSHGSEVVEIADHVHSLWPQARGFRSHSFYDHTHITTELRRRGLYYDSNICLWLQPNCVPLSHVSGLVRFPVFWEDDVHFSRDYPFDLRLLREVLHRPGLKVINFHPIHLALNVPNNDFYQQNKHLNRISSPEAWQASAYRGAGVKTLLIEMIEYIQSHGFQTNYLWDMFLKVTAPRGEGCCHPTGIQPPHAYRASSDVPAKTVLDEYRNATAEERAAFVQKNYDRRDRTQKYVTSRDFHLRELEITFLAQYVQPGKVLDLGCGNGYTLLSLARRVTADYLGVDFSSNMIEGAKSLMREMAGELKCFPSFQQADVRELTFPDANFDCVISERCLLNLPCRDDQWQAIREVFRILKPGGMYLMVEGTEDGLRRLNRLRELMNLATIPSVAPDNASSLKFHEAELESVLEPMFEIKHKHFFSLYYLISRVIHPVLAAPEEPKFDSKINAIARELSDWFPTQAALGHVVGYHLIARK